MRDPTKLRAFELADQLAMKVYQATKSFPREEIFGLTAQMRRSAVSIASNIVEGSARSSQSDYVHFLTIAYSSACELDYQLSLAVRLHFLTAEQNEPLRCTCKETVRVLNGLICSLRKQKPEA